jgi:LemA protein
MEIFFFGLVLALLVAGTYLLVTYNGLVRLGVRVDEAWSGITVQLQRRADLIPNLVSTVQGYAAHERGVFEAVTAARAATVNPETLSSPKETAAADNQLAGALKSLFAVAEAYPQLQASQNFLQLQSELSDTEDKVMAARRFYNTGVRDLNVQIKVFPNNVVAGAFGFQAREFFEVEDRPSLESAPTVSF